MIMAKVVKELYYCDVCGEQLEGKVEPMPRAIREVGYWGDYRYVEHDKVIFHIKHLDLCEKCKEYSDAHLIGMASAMGTDVVEYNWLKGQGLRSQNNDV